MTEEKPRTFFQRRLRDPLVAQLTQGVTPKHLALTCAVGGTLGLFPILGSTTALCFLAGLILKMNQPALQAVNFLLYPAQIALFPVFVRAGERLFNAPPITFSPMQLSSEFMSGPGPFMAKYGAAGWHGIVVWMIIAPFLIAAIYVPLVPLFKKMAAWRTT